MESRERTLTLIETKLKCDDGLETTSVSLSLRCPLNLSRIVRPMKGKTCNHIQCFEGHSVFTLVGNRMDGKFACPICSEMLRIPMDLVCDTYFMELLNSVPSHCNSITLKPNGEWCPDIVDEDIQGNCVIDLTGCVDDPDEELPERWKNIVVKREKDLDRSVSNLLSDLMGYKSDKGLTYPNIVPKPFGAPPARAASDEIVIVSSEDEEHEGEVEFEENDGEVEDDETDNNSEDNSYDYSDDEDQLGSLHDGNFTGNPGLLRTINFQDKDFLSALEQTLLFASKNNEPGMHYEERETSKKRSRLVQPTFMNDNRGYYPIRIPTKNLVATKNYNNHNINHREILGHSTNNRQAFGHYTFNKPSSDHPTNRDGAGTVASPIVID